MSELSSPSVDPALAELLGDRYTESAFERSFYRRDLASVPPTLAALVGDTLPSAVARPRTAEEVSTIIGYARQHKLPVTPRAAATTAYWNAVPMRGGLVLDLNGLRGLVSLDEAALTATMLPGTRWQELDRALARRGYALLSYPTSAPSATVGGWISMEGHGIGSLKHDGVAEQVTGLEVVLADGSIVYVPGTSEVPGTLTASRFAGAEGTLGIITRVELRIRRQPAATGHHLLIFPDMAALQAAAAALAAATPRPFYAHFAAPTYGRFMRRAGFEPVADGPLLALTYDGEPDEVAAGAEAVRREAVRCRGEALSSQAAAREWDERFLALRLKRAGPSVLGAESWLPLAGIAGYEAGVSALAAQQGLLMATYGTVVTPGLATVMSLYPCDESRLISYVLALSLTKKLYDVAFRHGGRPYGTGVWNTPYLSRTFSRAELAERRSHKAHMDPSHILNPGKAYQPPPVLWSPTFKLGMELLAGVRRAAQGAL
ncbi:MAG: FAD-binding oxidoreductase [Chloroflexi bacterium]|nr:FAD-binding oxidoreductase [Chloroflexota bacterium]